MGARVYVACVYSDELRSELVEPRHQPHPSRPSSRYYFDMFAFLVPLAGERANASILSLHCILYHWYNVLLSYFVFLFILDFTGKAQILMRGKRVLNITVNPYLFRLYASRLQMRFEIW